MRYGFRAVLWTVYYPLVERTHFAVFFSFIHVRWLPNFLLSSVARWLPMSVWISTCLWLPPMCTLMSSCCDVLGEHSALLSFLLYCSLIHSAAPVLSRTVFHVCSSRNVDGHCFWGWVFPSSQCLISFQHNWREWWSQQPLWFNCLRLPVCFCIWGLQS